MSCNFLGIVNICVRNRHCANHALLGESGGMLPPPPEIFEKNSCPETESGGFWQLSDYPTLVFKITAFNICKCILEQGFKVIIYVLFRYYFTVY